ncbi:MAG: tetratricopeptide repeat protein, partial [Candidatus Cloacimonetes bacterium]|nr:tetratricopeptide repeat protein [Candidatus Cloacimonadota bacterium]
MNKAGFATIGLILLMIIRILPLTAQEFTGELKDKYEEKKAFKQEVYDKTLSFIRQNPNSPKLPDLYFNMGELSIEIDVDNPAQTVSYFEKVIALQPDYERRDVVLYNIGYYSFMASLNERNDLRLQNLDQVINWPESMRLSEQKLAKSIAAFQEIMDSYPDSEYYTESIYRLGTVYFELALDARNPQEYYSRAIEYFDVVANQTGDPLQHYGLFQRGWSNFSSGKFERAIEDFSRILEIIELDSLRTRRAFFEADAIENIAFSLIEYDGTDYDQASVAAAKAKEIFTTFVNDDYGKL